MVLPPMTEIELEKFVGVLKKRRSLVEHLIVVAENVCNTLDGGIRPTESQRSALRSAIEAVNNSRLLGTG